MRFLLAIIAIFAIAGCKEQAPPEAAPYCGIMFSAVAGASQGIASAFECSDIAAIAGDLSVPIQKLNICPKGDEKVQGLIGDIVCPQMVTFVTGLGVAALPPKWGCKGGKPVADLNKFLTDQCKQHVTF
jgi:hypothetical protein